MASKTLFWVKLKAIWWKLWVLLSVFSYIESDLVEIVRLIYEKVFWGKSKQFAVRKHFQKSLRK